MTLFGQLIVGKKVILQATLTGGPRYMFERQQDVMSYVCLNGRSDLQTGTAEAKAFVEIWSLWTIANMVILYTFSKQRLASCTYSSLADKIKQNNTRSH